MRSRASFHSSSSGDRWNCLQPLRRHRHELRADEAGRLGGLRGRVLVAALHPLVVAVALVLRGLEERVDAQPLARPVHGCVELQAGRQHLGAVAELAAELFVPGDLPLPFRERRLPLGVGLEQRRKIPRVRRLDLAARREGLGLGLCLGLGLAHGLFVRDRAANSVRLNARRAADILLKNRRMCNGR